MWYELPGQCVTVSGTSGTPTIPLGAVILNVQALPDTGGGTIVMPDGTGSTCTITLPDGSNGYNWQPFHVNRRTTSANQIVFAGTKTYSVDYMIPKGVSVVS